MPIGHGFAFSVLSFSFTDSLSFIENCSLATLIASVQFVPKTLFWYVEILQIGFEGIFVVFPLATLRAISLLLFSI